LHLLRALVNNSPALPSPCITIVVAAAEVLAVVPPVAEGRVSAPGDPVVGCKPPRALRLVEEQRELQDPRVVAVLLGRADVGSVGRGDDRSLVDGRGRRRHDQLPIDQQTGTASVLFPLIEAGDEEEEGGGGESPRRRRIQRCGLTLDHLPNPAELCPTLSACLFAL
jgi:hypothetical protein